MTLREILFILWSTTAMFTALGGLTGYALGRFNPGYYRFVFRAEHRDHFDPVAVGIGQGVTQGLSGGAFIGVVVIAVLAWFRSREASRRDASGGPGGHSVVSPAESLRSRLPSIMLGGIIGLAVGAVWTAVIGPLTDGPPSMALSFAVYTLALTCTGLVVGAVRRSPILVGLGAGVMTLVCAAVCFGPSDGWIMLWVTAFGVSGFICGPLIGGLYYAAQRRGFA